MNKTIIIIAVFVLFIQAVYAEESIIVSLQNQDPDPAITGEIVELRFQVENRGDSAIDNYILEIYPEWPFEEVAGQSLVKELGSLDESAVGDYSKNLKFKVLINKDATAGSYNIPVLGYADGEKDDIQMLFSVDVQSRESAEVIYIDKVELIPGKITPMKFTINNVGSTPLRELTFTWENEDDIILPVGADNTKHIKYVDVGDSAELDFDVIASTLADPDLYKLDLFLTYDDPITGEQKEISTKAGVYVGGSTDFDIAFSGSSNGEYTFLVSNIGIVAASSVTVKIPDQTGWRVSGSNSVIIGNLNEGDYTIAGFNLQQGGSGQMTSSGPRARTQDTSGTSAPTSNTDPTIKVDIVYTDSRGNRNTISKEVAVESTPMMISEDGTPVSFSDMRAMRQKQNQNIFVQLWSKNKTLILGIIAFIVAIFVYRKYKKEKLKNSKYSYLKAIKDIVKSPFNMFKKKK